MRASNLAFERAGLGWGLLGSLFRLGRELCLEPLDDAAFQCDSSEALTDELRGDVRARQFVWIRVVHDDVSVARESRSRSIACPAHRPGEANGTVLVRVLETSIDQDRSRVALQACF